MDFTLNDEHEALRDSARRFLDAEASIAPLLIPGATAETSDYVGLWKKVTELGWQGMIIPESYGGLGMDYVDLIMIVGEIGRTLAPLPFFGNLAGTLAVLAGGSEDQKSELLAEVAAGNSTLAFAIADEGGSYSSNGNDVLATQANGGYLLTGKRGFVVDCATANKVVVPAKLDGNLEFFIVDTAQSQVNSELVEWRDITRQVSAVAFDGAKAERLEGKSAANVWPFVRDRLYLVLAAESAAGTQAALDDAVAYAKERVAFGKPIGSFQAIKHQLAEITGQVGCAIVASQYAAWALSVNDDKAPMAAAMAQSYASEAYRDATYRNIQVFGAIGFTWEMKNHLYYKRARCNAELLGPPAQQREEVMRMLEQQAA